MHQPSVAVLMFVAWRAFERRVIEGLHDAGYDVTYAQGRIAARLDPYGVRLTELAEMAQVTKQSAGFLVDQLEKAGYVERVLDPTDARARLVRLAPRGEAAQAAVRSIEAQVETEWTAYLGTEAMTALQAALARLREITDPCADRAAPPER